MILRRLSQNQVLAFNSTKIMKVHSDNFTDLILVLPALYNTISK